MNWVQRILGKKQVPEIKPTPKIAGGVRKKNFECLVEIQIDGEPWRKFKVMHRAYTSRRCKAELSQKLQLKITKTHVAK